MFPDPATSRRFDDPVAAARAFAVDFVGFVDPVLGEFVQGDSRSGEVEIRPVADGPATTVFVRQLGSDGTWWVIGSATGDITLDTPAAGDEITSPVAVLTSAVPGTRRTFISTPLIRVQTASAVRVAAPGM